MDRGVRVEWRPDDRQQSAEDPAEAAHGDGTRPVLPTAKHVTCVPTRLSLGLFEDLIEMATAL